jgi:hypothetical protein
MKLKNLFGSVLLASSALFGLSGTAVAADVLCKTVTLNHMLISDTIVERCVDAGVGNIGNGQNDDFLEGNASFTGTDLGSTPTLAGVSYDAGTFSIAASFWDNYDQLFVGFKFGTGNEPDEWFVYELNQDSTGGAYTFVNVFGQGGGLSHITLYGAGDGSGDSNETPEPGTLALLAIALLGIGAAQRRRKA